MILSLDGRELRRSDFERYVAELEAQQQTALEPSVRAALLQDWLERRVLVLAARSRGLLRGEAAPEEERLAVETLLSAEIGPKLAVTEQEIAAYYAAHADEFAVPAEVTLRQILVPTANEARDVKRRLQKDPKTFELLAQTVSRGPEASRGGLMGSFAAGQLPPELEAAAFPLQPGQTTGVVQTSLGHHVLRVEARSPARTLSLAEARDPVHARLLAGKSARAQRDFVAGLMARAKVNHEAAKTTRT
ncbi:MAG TPA: peptidylprolyl isomerase, partial [Methylomirabilota bacterium]|nr:peptidylprolyl isomerase [Methylomirabilota bacterium]